MNISSLSDSQLIDKLISLTKEERSITVTILEYLNELEKRDLYRTLGYASLFDYCTRVLKYSQASAYRRIAAARCLKDNPEISDLLRDGKLTLCALSTAAKSIQAKATKVEDIVGCTKKEAEVLLLQR